MANQAHSLRKAIENLVNVKLYDALAKPGGLDRLAAHRSTRTLQITLSSLSFARRSRHHGRTTPQEH